MVGGAASPLRWMAISQGTRGPLDRNGEMSPSSGSSSQSSEDSLSDSVAKTYWAFGSRSRSALAIRVTTPILSSFDSDFFAVSQLAESHLHN